MIIDVHTHLDIVLPGVSKNIENNLRLLLAEMKKSKVDHAFVLASFQKNSRTHPSTSAVLKFVKGLKNIHVVGSLDAMDIKKSELDELEELLREKKIVAIKLYPGYQYFYPNDDKCTPIYELCQKYDVPVMFHSGATLNGVVGQARVKYSHPLHIDDVAASFPDLKIVIAHLGNPWLVDCAEVVYKNKNVYADLSGFFLESQNDKAYTELMYKRINEFIAYASGDKLLYGTDWPLTPMTPYIKFVKSLNLKLIPGALDGAFYRNAIKLFNINV